MRILVTGASGLLGLNLCLHLADRHQLFGALHFQKLIDPPFRTYQVDLFNDLSIESLIKKSKPDLLVNCAAMANVDLCESQPEAAHRINAQMPGQLAALCRQNGIRFVHISTDAVFDGLAGDYTEEDSPNPLSVYARTKLEGENLVAAENKDAIIARVNFYGYSLRGKRSLAEFFLNNLRSGSKVDGFVDVIFCPLYVTDLVNILMTMVEKDLKGLYHVVSPESLSKYAFGVKIADRFGFSKNLIQPKSVFEAGLAAVRSPRLTLKIDKLKAAEILPPGQDECITHLYAHYLENLPEKIKAYAGEADA
jgi:dTDP-4-dehydrorhamnose reductase